MKTHHLTAEKRTTTGRKVKNLRKQGIVPANIFGKKTKSIAISIDGPTFEKVYKEAGETGIVEVVVEKATHPVLITNVQIHPVSRQVIHADLHEVDLKEKVHADIPVVIIGEAKAVSDKIGVLLNLLDKVEVEALPTELPEHIEVDVTSLATVGDVIKVGDLKIPSGVELHTDRELEVVKIDELVTKEAEKDAEAAKEAAAEAGAEDAEKATEEGLEEKKDEKKEPASSADKEEKKEEKPAAPEEKKE